MEFMHDLPIRKVPGIGKVNERILEAFDIKTCGDIYQHRAIIHLMDHHLGLRSLLGAYMGLGSNNVHPMKREERKSVGSETTFNPTANVNVLLDKLSHVAESLADDLERTGFAGKTITLKYKLDNFKVFTRAKSCNRWITSKDDLYQIGKELFMKEKLPLKMRLIGLRATTLKDLRVAEDRGIGKFFEKAERGSPVKKKRKAEDPEIIMISSDNDDPDEAFTLADQEKPNFFGDDDADEEEVMFTHVQVPQQSKPHSHAGTSSSASSSRPLRLERAKPVSAGPSKARSNQIPSPSTNDIQQPKQDDSLVQVAQGSRPPVEKQECPICSRVLETDNAGLNEHIDFCLSRGEIKRASAQGSDPDLGSTIKKNKKKKRANPFSKH
ncbi:hypothetical protein FRC03_007593 [Tulasnella sp. 419]|nr:hypothetical protein FRC03_007593 [Tulasnella sp. 419]